MTPWSLDSKERERSSPAAAWASAAPSPSSWPARAPTWRSTTAATTPRPSEVVARDREDGPQGAGGQGRRLQLRRRREAWSRRCVETFGRLRHPGLQRRHHLGRRDLEDDRGAVGHGHRASTSRATSTTTRPRRWSSRTRSTARSSTSRRSTACAASSPRPTTRRPRAARSPCPSPWPRSWASSTSTSTWWRPGMVLTDMMEKIPPEFKNAALAETVLGRFATPEDVAAPGGVPLLGPVAAHHRRGDQDRRRPVHLAMAVGRPAGASTGGACTSRSHRNRTRRLRPAQRRHRAGAGLRGLPRWRCRTPGIEREELDASVIARGARVPQAALGGRRGPGVPEPQPRSRPG